jgi:mannitol/fructose-specific phosphotransferase system IIA component (Ntr-type)
MLERQQGVYAQRFPNRNHPDHKTIFSVIARTVETDQVLMTVRTVENEEAILDAFEEGTESIREVDQ